MSKFPSGEEEKEKGLDDDCCKIKEKKKKSL